MRPIHIEKIKKGVKTMLVEELRCLIDDAELYTDLMRPEGGEIRIAVLLTDSGEEATLIIGEQMEVVEGSESPDLRLTMDRSVFDSVLEGEADFGALIGRSRVSDVRPINFQLLSPERAIATTEIVKTMMTHFFNPGKVKIKRLQAELAGEAHGAHPIPLVYWEGLRFAWITVKKGEVMNEEGERDPYPQVIVILRGKGVFQLEDDEFDLEPNTAIYVPVNSVHKIRAEEDVEVVWLAWQAPP